VLNAALENSEIVLPRTQTITIAIPGKDTTNSGFNLRQKTLTFDMTGSYAHPYAYYEASLRLVDHPRERLHQHNTLLGVATHKNSNQKAYPNHPNVDITDANGCYLIELEVPGIMSADSIALNWTSWRSLVVSSSSFRSWELDTSAKALHDSFLFADEQLESRNELEVAISSASIHADRCGGYGMR
jgi:HSP20 family molecular chaperone IbpA